MIKNRMIVGLLAVAGIVGASNAVAQENTGACVKSSDVKVNVGGSFQFRYGYATDVVGSDDDLNGFNMPLARLNVNGNVHKDIDYRIQGMFSSDGGEFTLEDAFGGVTVWDGARVQFGQFVLPFLAENNITEEFQLAADRSVVSDIFGQGRAQGVQFGLAGESYGLNVAVSDGFNTANTEFDDAQESDFALTARGEYAIFGKIADFKTFSALPDQASALMVGAAAHYQDENDDAESMLSYTGDINYKVAGFNSFLAAVGRQIDGGAGTVDDFGVVAQAGYRITESFEPFARFESVMPDSDRAFSEDAYNFVTAGVNYYVYGYAAKFTLDGVWALQATQELAGMNDFSDVPFIQTDDENGVALRAQFQVLF